MAFNLFGFTFNKDEQVSSSVRQLVTPSFSDPTFDLQSGGFISPTGTSFQIGSQVKSENEAIGQYRDIAREPEVDLAVEEIISEMLVFDQSKPSIVLNMDLVDIPDKVKLIIDDEFKYVMGLLDFNVVGHNIAKRWYIDGRLNYLITVDENAPQNGIMQLQYIDPYKIKRIRELERGFKDGIPSIKSQKEYFIYNEAGVDNNSISQTSSGSNGQTNAMMGAIAITTESIATANSGLFDPDRGFIISALETAIKTVNSLRNIEESQLIYTMTRAPERRVFYIDIGNLSKAKADQYVKEIADKYRTKILYDPVSGKVRNEKKFLAMTEDFWIPRSGDGRSTQIETLPAGDAFTSTEQQDYYKDKLWQALKVPSSRFSGNSLYNSGINVTRDELRFFKYIQSLRMQFNNLFVQLLSRQLMLKGIVDSEDWEYIKDNIVFEYAQDNYFSQAVENDVLQAKLGMLQIADQFVGKYYGKDYIYTNILKVHKEDADAMRKDAKQALDEESKRQDEIQIAQAKTELEIQMQQQQVEQQGAAADPQTQAEQDPNAQADEQAQEQQQAQQQADEQAQEQQQADEEAQAEQAQQKSAKKKVK